MLEGSLKEKDQKINELKKNMKVTKLDECRVQLEVAEAESLRLRRALDELIRVQEDQRQVLEHSREQETELKRLRRQNNELYNALNSKKDRDNDSPRKINDKQKIAKLKAELTAELNELKAKLQTKEELDYPIEGESKEETLQRLRTQRQKHEEMEMKYSKDKDKIDKRIKECNACFNFRSRKIYE
jgi:chromosome segregation ATPase